MKDFTEYMTKLRTPSNVARVSVICLEQFSFQNSQDKLATRLVSAFVIHFMKDQNATHVKTKMQQIVLKEHVLTIFILIPKPENVFPATVKQTIR